MVVELAAGLKTAIVGDTGDGPVRLHKQTARPQEPHSDDELSKRDMHGARKQGQGVVHMQLCHGGDRCTGQWLVEIFQNEAYHLHHWPYLPGFAGLCGLGAIVGLVQIDEWRAGETAQVGRQLQHEDVDKVAIAAFQIAAPLHELIVGQDFVRQNQHSACQEGNLQRAKIGNSQKTLEGQVEIGQQRLSILSALDGIETMRNAGPKEHGSIGGDFDVGALKGVIQSTVRAVIRLDMAMPMHRFH